MSGRDYRHPWAASVKWPGPPAPRVVEYAGLLLHPSDHERMVATVRAMADEAERERRREILEALGVFDGSLSLDDNGFAFRAEPRMFEGFDIGRPAKLVFVKEDGQA